MRRVFFIGFYVMIGKSGVQKPGEYEILKNVRQFSQKKIMLKAAFQARDGRQNKNQSCPQYYPKPVF